MEINTHRRKSNAACLPVAWDLMGDYNQLTLPCLARWCSALPCSTSNQNCTFSLFWYDKCVVGAIQSIGRWRRQVRLYKNAKPKGTRNSRTSEDGNLARLLMLELIRRKDAASTINLMRINWVCGWSVVCAVRTNKNWHTEACSMPWAWKTLALTN